MIHPTDNLRDYAVGELSADELPAIQEHLAICGECALELDRLRVTMAALRILPDCEIPQRIGFVSDKVFEPSAVSRFFAGFWNSAARLGFASACVLGGALLVSAYHRPAAEVHTVIQAGNQDVSKQVNDAVARAVSQIRNEDAQMTRAAVESVNRKYKHEYQSRMLAVEESYTVLQKRLSNSLVASNERPNAGDGR
jgi:anti-sigma factor RsiW